MAKSHTGVNTSETNNFTSLSDLLARAPIEAARVEKEAEIAKTVRIPKPKNTWCRANPLWVPDGCFGVFNEILRSPVFSLMEKSKVRIINAEKNITPWSKDLLLKLSGPQMGQHDLGVYLGILSFYNGNAEGKVYFTMSELLKKLEKKSIGGKNFKIVKESIKRQLEATIYVFDKVLNKEIFGGHIVSQFKSCGSINELYYIQLNINFINLSRDKATWIDLETWNKLGKSITKFAYTFFCSHRSTMRDPTKITLENLKMRSGSKASYKAFKFNILKYAIPELKKNGAIFDAWLEGEDILCVARHPGVKMPEISGG